MAAVTICSDLKCYFALKLPPLSFSVVLELRPGISMLFIAPPSNKTKQNKNPSGCQVSCKLPIESVEAQKVERRSEKWDQKVRRPGWERHPAWTTVHWNTLFWLQRQRCYLGKGLNVLTGLHWYWSGASQAVTLKLYCALESLGDLSKMQMCSPFSKFLTQDEHCMGPGICVFNKAPGLGESHARKVT